MVQSHKFCAVISALSAVLLVACKQDLPQNPSQDPIKAQELTIPEQVFSQDATNAAVIAQKKANVQDHCPRLVQKKVDSNQVLRRDSMASQTCDYFIYPYVGDTIKASISDDRIHLGLVRPDTHDFANGSFVVTKNGRHVIRLEYDAFGRRPMVMDYTIEIEIIPPKSE